MPTEIVMPRMGLTMEEGTVLAWRKQPGQAVAAGEPLLEIETDKATVEIEAPAAGVLGTILAQAGETRAVGAVVGYLLAVGEAAAGKAAADQAATGQAAAGEVAAGIAAATASQPPAASGAKPRGRAQVRASPAARHQARLHGVDLGNVAGTGPGGRVVAWNVASAPPAASAAAATPALASAVTRASPVAQRVAADLGVDLSQVAGTGASGRVMRQDVERAAAPQPPTATAAPGTVQPLTRAQRLAADRMTASFATAPHFYLHAEVDARPLLALRAALLPRLQARAGVHLTVTDLLIHFCARTLVQHPRVWAQWADGGWRQGDGIHIGVAVDTPAGLVVPVIRDAHQLGLTEIARRRADLGARARAGKLLPPDLELGVFTLTNLGMFNVDAFEAILNPPQAAILAVGRIKERALVDHGAVIAAPTLNLSLSADHRVLDGAAGARFLGDLVDLLEQPALALS
jgi:pyruvate dehydrogenase E2 component (dihydrolipoamide acetyltransferase)